MFNLEELKFKIYYIGTVPISLLKLTLKNTCKKFLIHLEVKLILLIHIYIYL